MKRLAPAVAALVVLSGCAAGPNAVTLKQYTPTDGNQVTSGSLKIRNLLIVAQQDGSASLIGTVINTSDVTDTLMGITVNGQPVEISAESLEIPRSTPLVFGGESATAAGVLPLSGIKAGQFADVQLTFAKAGLLETSALVRAANLEFAPQS